MTQEQPLGLPVAMNTEKQVVAANVDSKNEDVYTEKLAFCKFHGVVSTDSSRRAFAVPGG